MSTNHRRRHYSAGTSALAASGPDHAASGRQLRSHGRISGPNAPVPSANVVELYPGSASTYKAGRIVLPSCREAGMATAEYAIATLAAVGFAGLLVFILRSDEVRGFLLNLIRTALALP
ncbi:MAG: DUF4244 domain-containing protein [Actinomycetes bacterium]